jgi:hypothetical protein
VIGVPVGRQHNIDLFRGWHPDDRRPTVAELVREATRSLTAAAADEEPLTALRHAVDARAAADALVRELAAHAHLWHGDQGASWAQIGAELGVTRQAAQQRYGAAAAQLLRDHIRAGYRQTAPEVETRRQDELTPESEHPGT